MIKKNSQQIINKKEEIQSMKLLSESSEFFEEQKSFHLSLKAQFCLNDLLLSQDEVDLEALVRAAERKRKEEYIEIIQMLKNDLKTHRDTQSRVTLLKLEREKLLKLKREKALLKVKDVISVEAQDTHKHEYESIHIKEDSIFVIETFVCRVCDKVKVKSDFR